MIALGSNQPRSRRLTPRRLVEQAIGDFSRPPFRLIARSPILETPPIGPSRRRYANAALLVEAPDHSPDAMLKRLKAMERAAGRRTRQRWGARPLDLDIVLWSGGAWASPGLVIPHTAFRERDFVLIPLSHIVPDWRDPISGQTIAHLLAQFKKPKKLSKSG
ncbi:MAG: 2-amino-4-hydroxy-6-hydroxymethyldihydropteridine diphosphokinase [Sphingobium sp. 32-64-5]|nr:MAG: 2-amino-4-hydroxy-6-hydroxymethyldihydropteridine diphosphokinase [Sphingobium sp. 32-64-5]